MKKIKLYMVTYNNEENLNLTLHSLFLNTKIPIEIYVINNHSKFRLFKIFEPFVTKVLHNVLRPDFSTGHLSRNWNQALILGFENLKEPKADIVIGCQEDTIFYPSWLENLLKLHEKYSFITYGWGDNFMSWTPEAVKRIGLWDESFQMSGHTSDYFLRALLYNKEKSSINDYHHSRLLNIEKIKIADRLGEIKEHQAERKFNAPYGKQMIEHKWEELKYCSPMIDRWESEFIEYAPKIKQKCSNRIIYPYFEKDVETLKEQKYV